MKVYIVTACPDETTEIVDVYKYSEGAIEKCRELRDKFPDVYFEVSDWEVQESNRQHFVN